MTAPLTSAIDTAAALSDAHTRFMADRAAADREADANARLLAAAPDLLAAAIAVDQLLTKMQAAVVAYLQPGGLDGAALINELIGHLDGPEQREAQGALEAAIAKATGR